MKDVTIKNMFDQTLFSNAPFKDDIEKCFIYNS